MGLHHAHTINGRPKVFVVDETAGAENPETFTVTATLTALLAGTAVVALPDARVLTPYATRIVQIDDFDAKVNGATAWTTTTSVVIEGTDGTAFVTIAVAALTANAYLGKHSANVTVAGPMCLRTGGTLGFGLQVRGNVNAGAGSDLVFVIKGKIIG